MTIVGVSVCVVWEGEDGNSRRGLGYPGPTQQQGIYVAIFAIKCSLDSSLKPSKQRQTDL